jgi:hypothetical protein
MRRFMLVVVFALFVAATANAQTKTTGTFLFGKADPALMIPVGDQPGHFLGIDQSKGPWTTPVVIGGDKTKEGVSTATHEIHGTTSRTRGTHVGTMESGDKYFVSYQGMGTVKDGAPTGDKGTWSYTGGTGKLKGITGKGTYSCTPSGDGFSCVIEGDYQLPK